MRLNNLIVSIFCLLPTAALAVTDSTADKGSIIIPPSNLAAVQQQLAQGNNLRWVSLVPLALVIVVILFFWAKKK